MLSPLILIPGYPSRFDNIILLQREKRSGDNTQFCLTPHFTFLDDMISSFTGIAVVCSQYMFFIADRSFPSTFKCVSCAIIQ